ncbi:acid protease [Tothia fuscella]|uniref:Acid protease n=1 Tax=Tothia fuscella TaxID=1048955 RepID=A0A9P4U0G8_9PEZI|nr:acid protease [Tothia fuscella]
MAVLRLQVALLCLFLSVSDAWSLERREAAAVVRPAPIDVGLSQYWDGGEGNWSSFMLRLGSGPQTQNLRVLPSTSMESIWAALPMGCPTGWIGGVTDCSARRGGLYNATISEATSTFTGNYSIKELEALRNYGLDGEVAVYEDTATLNYQGTAGVSLEKQVVFGFAGWNFTLVGLLGLNPYPVNLTAEGGMNYFRPSYMTSMRDKRKIPSLSYSYTAGAKYQNGGSGVHGSLILGGYDSARFNPKTQATWGFAVDMEKHLMVRIDTIEWNWPNSEDTSGSPPVFREVNALVDSSRPFMYLPLEACKRIAKEWELSYDKQSDYYFVNDTIHAKLSRMQPFLRFKLGNFTENPGKKAKLTNTTITLPYDSLVHYLSYPYAPVRRRFIPIRANSDPEAYVLGRVFLQHAHLTVDHERQQFSLAQALFNTTQLIKPILPINETKNEDESSLPLPVPAIAGIAAGAAVLIAILLLALFCLRRAKKNKKRQAEEAAAIKETDLQSPLSPSSPEDSEKDAYKIMELDSGTIHEAGGMPTYPIQEIGMPKSPIGEEMPDDFTLAYGGFYKETKNDSGDGRPIIKVFYEMDATPPGSTENTPTGTLNSAGSGTTMVNTLSNPQDAHLRPAAAGRGGNDPLSPIPQTPVEFYGAAAVPGSAGQRGWIGRAPPDLPRVVLVPATPISPTPGERERSRWLKGHSGRRKRGED